MAKLTGIPASPGVAIGRVFPVDRRRARVPRYHIQPDQIESEIARLDEAVQEAVKQLAQIKQSLGEGEQEEILDAHGMMANDPTMLEGAKQLIREELLNAEWATRRVVREMSEKMGADGYLAERRADLDEVCDRIVHNLIGEKPMSAVLPAEPSVIVAYDLATADAAVLLASGKALGLVTDFGSKTSHTAILARAMEVPCVVGAGQASEIAKAGDLIAVDGGTGEVLVSPDKDEVLRFEMARAEAEFREASLLEDRDLPAVTLDGRRVCLYANIEFPEEVPSVLAHGGEGVGLYRTEFLYLNREELPTEEEHYTAYAAILERMEKKPVVIRTVDLGGDKLPVGHRSHEPNPALGLRAVRFTLRHPQLFRTQLRALLRASTHGDLRIMLPMIAAVGELREAKAQIESARQELLREGKKIAERIPVGIMLETPAACLAADRLARECDFFSVGTNDLIQYALAIDRGNREVAYLYRPLHLGVLRLIQSSVDGAKKAGIEISMCGEMAGDPAYALVLLALGLDTLSMNPADIPAVKRVLRSARVADARQLLDEAMSFSSVDEIEGYVLAQMQKRFPQLVTPAGRAASERGAAETY
ncbi:MAG: phosphoenolpyruvate--protein phosphotransferase [Deltaproteobacteria bacterium]|nr:MAG: phosphoenolpyruvate--protein phosphotransferase [Deltaproteobacteria bacterium]